MIVQYNLMRCATSNMSNISSLPPNIETTTVIAEIPDTVASLIYQGWSITGINVENDIAGNTFPGNIDHGAFWHMENF